MKSEIGTRRGQMAIDSKIRRLTDKIEALKAKNVRIQKVQRSLLYPKFLYLQRKQRKIDKAEGRVLFNEERINDNEVLKSTVDKDSFLGSFKSMIYDIKGVFYKKRYERAQEILRKMNNKYAPVKAKSARTIKLKKGTKYKLRALPTPAPTPAAAPAI
jgi:hypothetical protein